MTIRGKVDVHAHYLPAPYRERLAAADHDRPDGMPQIPAWDAAEHVALMDRLGIATSLTANTHALFPHLAAHPPADR